MNFKDLLHVKLNFELFFFGVEGGATKKSSKRKGGHKKKKMIGTGDVNLYGFKDLKCANDFGRNGGAVFGETPCRELVALEEWTKVHLNHKTLTVEDLCEFMERHLLFQYRLLSNNCIVTAQTRR
ncbi:hypothetical protein RFI_20690 [Reticulomyxa filosa]|uniref:Uncharacterized protein n=1 Tax=Reticulomyxa filosa TaxID=46433 RepID=X6MS28_RETFI|nr:hypothetical protein RFI_20690 [Reticulomyxa filosa]|eukprot:ETO16649.1 hypothetical protein RFI_20690 [Reticulomyxa filosa]